MNLNEEKVWESADGLCWAWIRRGALFALANGSTGAEARESVSAKLGELKAMLESEESAGIKRPEMLLGSRAILVGGKPVGICKEFALTMEEATDEEMELLRVANEILLVRYEGE